MRKQRFKGARRSKGILGILMPIGLLCAIVIMLHMGLHYLTQANEQEALESTRNAVVRAMVQFYSIEGYYPPTLDYLAERYGLQLDTERFIIHYNASGSNIRPHVAVFLRDF